MGRTPVQGLELPPGSYLFTLSAGGRAPVRYPVLLSGGERHSVSLELPAHIPAGFVYAPPGRFLYGSPHEEITRRALLAQPVHEVHTPGYLIGRTEVTFGDWLAFLRDLPPEERARRRPHGSNTAASIEVEEPTPGEFVLSFQRSGQRLHLRLGERLRYRGRTLRQEQDWRNMPVVGITIGDARAYVAWLGRQVPGARLCTEHEWERAARGADGRLYPHGNRLTGDDANFDETYNRNDLAFGPDEVGAHPASDSPFGIADLAGNVWEWVSPIGPAPEIIFRGGGWYEGWLANLSVNRNYAAAETRTAVIGLRVCAPAAPAR